MKSDVYGFGVVLLELLTGLRALDTKRPTGQQNLVEWLKPMLSQKKKLKIIMDARIEGQYSSKAASQAAELTLKCLESDPKRRPSMKEVEGVLLQIKAMTIEKPKNSMFTALHSAPHLHNNDPIAITPHFIQDAMAAASEMETKFMRTQKNIVPTS